MNIGFKSFHPITALLFFIFSFSVSLVSSNPYFIAICFLTGALYCLKLQGKRCLSYLIKFILPFIILITVFNGFVNHYGITVLFVLKDGNNFTLEALVYGFVSAVKIANMLLWLECFNEIITSEKIIFLFGRLSPRIALILSMVLRFIPLIRSQSEEINKAEKGIGNSNHINLFDKFKRALRRISILISWTLEKGIDTSDSMRARGYGLRGRTSYNSYIFSVKDLISTLSFAFSLVMLIISNEKLEAFYNPVIIIPEIDLISFLLLFIFFIVLLIPVVIDIWEEKRWKIS